jgi:hypothetical protein
MSQSGGLGILEVATVHQDTDNRPANACLIPATLDAAGPRVNSSDVGR